MTERTALLVPERQKAAVWFRPFAWRPHSIAPAVTPPANWPDGFQQKE